jgi:IS4 transposase
VCNNKGRSEDLAYTQCIDFFGVLKRLFPDDLIEALARQSGFLKRSRKIRPVAFFWTLVLGFSAGKTRTISGLRRMYERATGQTLVPSGFYGRFGTGSLGLLKACLDRALEQFRLLNSLPEKLAADLRDVFLADATVFKLRDTLRSSYRGCRRKKMPAAAKLHGVFSVTGKGKSTVALTGENVPEIRKLVVGPWVRGTLLLFDLGYFQYKLFTQIKKHGGAFITRVRKKANPRIVSLFQPLYEDTAPVEGMKIHDALKRLRGEILDAEVEIEFYPERPKGRYHTVRERFRVVGIYDADSRGYHLYMTSLLPAQLPPSAVLAMYRARWEIELLFKELKSGYRIDQVSSAKKEIAETLIYAALLTLLTSRRLLRAFAAGPKERNVNPTRWWRLFAVYAHEILLIVTRSPAISGAAGALSRTLEHELKDPHKRRRTPLIRAALLEHQPYPQRSQRPSRKDIMCLN